MRYSSQAPGHDGAGNAPEEHHLIRTSDLCRVEQGAGGAVRGGVGVGDDQAAGHILTGTNPSPVTSISAARAGFSFFRFDADSVATGLRGGLAGRSSVKRGAVGLVHLDPHRHRPVVAWRGR